MEPVAFVVDNVKGFAKSSQEFFQVVIHRRDNSARHNPMEILKRLQREAFSDMMKLRDRLEKVERMLFFSKSSRGNLFQESSTHVKGAVDVVGALLFVDNIERETCDSINRAGVRTGTDSRFIFESTIRQKDSLVTEFVASQSGQASDGGILGRTLSMTKVMYTAHLSDQCSAVLVSMGARCRDVGIASSSLRQGQSLTDFCWGPPLLNRYHDAAAALVVRKSKAAACLAEFVSGLRLGPDSTRIKHCFSTFGQVICQISKGTKLTLMGIHNMPKSQSQQIGSGFLTVPVGNLRLRRHLSVPSEASLPSGPGNTEDSVAATGSICLMLELDLDESSQVKGWVEMENSSPRNLHWAVGLSDVPEDELGWGLSLGGSIGGPSALDRFQAEAFLKFNSGKRFSFQPGFLYVIDGTKSVPALMFRSSWSL